MREDEIIRLVNALIPGGTLSNGVVAPMASETQALSRVRNLLSEPDMAPLAAAIERMPDIDELSLAALPLPLKTGFAKVVGSALTAYYETQAVVIAFGWRAQPPQPEGFALAAFDEVLLDPVRQRSAFWVK